MSKVVRFHKATIEPLTSVHVEDVIIQVILTDGNPDHASQGVRMADLLLESLPGGTVMALRDRLSEYIHTYNGGEE